MNKKCFRLVFNRHRGVLMPVASIVMAVSGLGSSPGASAQIRAHPDAAPHERPTVLRTANGVPLVNFHAPSPAGVSRSILSQFDIDRRGVVLNNSLYGAQTQLGGAVAGNPWLLDTPARIIVNEVRSPNPSQLRGDIEVAGKRAQVIVANPAGIVCDGCGFINAYRATLTTGVPQFRDGALWGYKVTDGMIRIGAGGMDATAAEVTDLLARGLEVQGRLLARSLQVATGPGTVSQGADGSLGTPSAATGSGPAPTWAIDISALGGLYAGSIRLVATQAGVGVRNAGAIGASVGGVVVTAAGRLENAGSIVARDDVRLQATSLDSRGLLAAGIDDENRATLPATLAVQSSGDMRIAGRALAGGDIDLRAKHMALSGASVDAAGRIDLRADGNLDNTGGQVIAGSGLTVRVGAALRNEGGILAVQGAQADLHVTAASLDNTDGRIANAADSQGDVRLDLDGALTNTRGRIGADRDVSVRASELLGAGEIAARRDLALTLDSGYTHSEDNVLASGRDLSLRLGGGFVNPAQGGTPKAGGVPLALAAVRDLRVEAANIDNSGDLVAGGALTLKAANIGNSGSIVGGSVLAQATEELRNEGPAALIGAANERGLLELLAPRVINRDPVTATDSMPTTTIFGMGDVVIAGGTDTQGQYVRAQSVLNESARIVAGGDLLVAADTLAHQRRVLRASSLYDVPMPGESGSVVYTPENPDVPGGRYIEPDHGGYWNADYIRTDYTATVARNRLEAVSPKSQIEAGGNFTPAVGTLRNYWSAITAAASIPLNGVTVDSDGWRGATPYSEQRNYSGVYVYRRYKGDYFTKGPWTDPPLVTPLGGYDASLTAGGSIAGTGNTIFNVAGATPHTPLGMQAGQPLDGRQQGSGAGSYDQFSLPQGGLYRVSPAPDSRYLVESHSAITRGRSWASSDTYFLEMGLDPSRIGKRLGDGFYEQQLVRSQLIALTGRTALDGIDAQAQFSAMLSAGAKVARALQLAPGAGLSAEQVAALTGDVVLMEMRVIQGQSVLVPVVYLAAASRQQLLPTGSLIAARDVVLTDTQDFRNSGVIRASNALVIDGTRIDNRGGRLASGGLMALSTRPGGDVDLTSAQVKAGSLDIDSGGRLVLATDAKQLEGAVAGGVRSITRLGQEGRIDVTGDASVTTAGDLIQSGAILAVGADLRAEVGGSWRMDSVETRESQQVRRAGGHSDTQVVGQVGSRLEVGGRTQAHAAQDLVAQGATMDLRGGGTLSADRDVVLGAAVRSERVDSSSQSRRHSETHQQLDEQVVGTRINSGADLAVVAGRDIELRAAGVQVDKGQALLQAGRDVNVQSVEERHELHDTHVSRQRGVLSSRTISTDDRSDFTAARGSSVSADGLEVVAGRDLRVQGSQVVGTGDALLRGGRDVTVEAATETLDESHARDERRSGLFSSGGLSVTLGTRQVAREQDSTQTTASASTVGSLEGNVRVEAGRGYRQVGSDVLAPKGDVDIQGRTVDIVEAREAGRDRTQTRFRQSGVTAAITNPVISAMQTVDQMQRAAGNTSDRRMQALAAATSALAVKNAADAVAKNPAEAGGINLSISLGSSRSASESTETRGTAAASRVVAGRDMTIQATGDGANSDVTIQGSDVKAGREAKLRAEGDVALLAARNDAEQHSTNSSSSASVGVSFGTDGFKVNVSGSRGRGNADGTDVIWTNTHVQAGERVSVESGGDTTLRGAIVESRQVQAVVGRNLAIESLQDTSEYASRQRSAGFSVSVGLDPASVISSLASRTPGHSGSSISASRSRVDSDYAGVTEQSAIRAGDGGFDVTVQGATTLRGGAITSTQAAVDAGRNRFETHGLTTSDIENQASYSAHSVGVGLGAGVAKDGSVEPNRPAIGFGSDSGRATSVTRAAISAIAGDTQARTGDAPSGVARIFNADRVQRDVDAQMQITQQFGREAPRAAATFAQGQALALRKEAQSVGDEARRSELLMEAAKWDEGGVYRVALHTVSGGFAGGVQGALGAGAVAAAAPIMDQLQSNLGQALREAGASEAVARGASQVIAGATSAIVGAAVSGGSTAGAAMAFNVDANNRQLHAPETQTAQELAKRSRGKYTEQQIADAMRNSGNGSLGESIVSGMVVSTSDPRSIYDRGSVFNAGAQGTDSIVQTLPNEGRVDPELASYIRANTGGDLSPYSWTNQQLGHAPPLQADPNAGLRTITPAANGAVTAEAAAGLLPAPSERRSVEEIDRDLKSGVCKFAIGSAANTLVPGSTVLRPVFVGVNRIIGWAVETGFNNVTASVTGAVVCNQ